MSVFDDIRADEDADAKETTNPNPIPEITARIKGYRQLSAEEQSLINEAKELSEQCGAFIEKLRTHQDLHLKMANKILPALEQRWVSIGATQLQQGFMAVIRGIAQPTTF